MALEQVVSVSTLKSIGLGVKVNHYRKYHRYENGRVYKDLLPNSMADVKYALPRGGMTCVTLIDKDGSEFSGISRCCDNDQFCKKTGVQLAIVEAVRQLLVAKTTVV